MQFSVIALLLALVFAFCPVPVATANSCTKADAELNKVYKAVRSRYRDDPLFLEKLKVAQRAWIKFRDAHIESQYPSPNKSDYGSIYGMCTCLEIAELTRARTKQLKLWLTGIEEGEGCYGSVKTKYELQSAAPPPKKNQPQARCDIRKFDWKNFGYDGGYTLRNGQAHWANDNEEHSISLTDVTYADLSGDGKPEAYVWVTDWKDWGYGGSQGSEDLYIYHLDAQCRPALLGRGGYFPDTPPGKIKAKRYVVEGFDHRTEWSFQNGKLTQRRKPLP